MIFRTLNLDNIRSEIERRIASLLEDSNSTADDRHPVELDQGSLGRLSRMDAIQMQAMALASEKRREAELEKLKAALHRIDGGEYGVCLMCSEDIAPKRLAADPSVPLCLHCAIKAG